MICSIIIFAVMATTVFGASPDNKTAISWSHATNSKELLENVLKSDIAMIEADIVWGYLNNETSQFLPVMGHPPANKSDISLEEFITRVSEFNQKQTSEKQKGIKLDFKTTEVFNQSIPILTKAWTTKFPIWLNADIISGPVNTSIVQQKPVDPKSFFEGSKKFNEATLSIGWTTKWGSDYMDGLYTDKQIDDMISSIKENSIDKLKTKLTFPVRAGIAAHSLETLTRLQKALNETNDVTFTIWSSDNDNVDIEKLRKLIFEIGLDKMYVDVPDKVSSQLRLDDPPNSSGRISTNWIIVAILLVCLRFFFK